MMVARTESVSVAVPTAGHAVGADRCLAGGEGRLVNMLVNMMGIEQIDEIIDMSDRRTEATVDPKSRVTLTTLFGEVLASFQGACPSPALTPATATAPIVGHDFVTRPAISAQVSQQDAA